MQNLKVEGLTPQEIKDNLEAECTQRVSSIFIKPFKDDQRDKVKLHVSTLEEEIFDHRIELAKLMEPIKSKIKELEELKNIALSNLKDGGLEAEEVLFEFFDRANKKVNRFTEEGIEVEYRLMTEEEIVQLHVSE